MNAPNFNELAWSTHVGVSCDFIEYSTEDGRCHRCGREARRFKRKDGKRFDVCEGGIVKENSRLKLNLCEQHFRDLSLIVALQEVIDERQFS